MPMYTGIDLHSTNNYVAILSDDGFEVMAERRVSNDLKEVLRTLAPFRNEIAGVAVESTFNWYWLVDGLMDNGYRVHLTNTNKAQQYNGLKHADDRTDAEWLALLLALGILPEGYIYPREDRPMRDLLRRRAFLMRKKVSMELSMRGAFESRTGLRPRRGDAPEWTDDSLVPYLPDADERMCISCLAEPVAVMTEKIKEIEAHVFPRAKLREEFRLLKTVWGIGDVLSLSIMYEVGSIHRFPSVGDFSSYCRLAKSKWTSNGKRKGSGNTKNGNPYLSWAFSEASHFAVQHHQEARKYFQRKRSKTNGIIANRALANKLARATYHVLRDQVPFDPSRVFAELRGKAA